MLYLTNPAMHATFSNRIESTQYNNAALEITETIKGTSKEKLYQERGFETMKERALSLQFTFLTKLAL